MEISDSEKDEARKLEYYALKGVRKELWLHGNDLRRSTEPYAAQYERGVLYGLQLAEAIIRNSAAMASCGPIKPDKDVL